MTTFINLFHWEVEITNYQKERKTKQNKIILIKYKSFLPLIILKTE